jgi:hypothetical protein
METATEADHNRYYESVLAKSLPSTPDTLSLFSSSIRTKPARSNSTTEITTSSSSIFVVGDGGGRSSSRAPSSDSPTTTSRCDGARRPRQCLHRCCLRLGWICPITPVGWWVCSCCSPSRPLSLRANEAKPLAPCPLLDHAWWPVGAVAAFLRRSSENCSWPRDCRSSRAWRVCYGRRSFLPPPRKPWPLYSSRYYSGLALL